MPLTATLAATSFGSALATVTATAGLEFDERKDNAIVIVASTVTSGATFHIEAKTESGAWVPVIKFAITATGSYAFPISDRIRRERSLDSNCQFRVSCVARTDGSYACSRNTFTEG
jgi:hypothetical protein